MATQRELDLLIGGLDDTVEGDLGYPSYTEKPKGVDDDIDFSSFSKDSYSACKESKYTHESETSNLDKLLAETSTMLDSDCDGNASRYSSSNNCNEAKRKSSKNSSSSFGSYGRKVTGIAYIGGPDVDSELELQDSMRLLCTKCDFKVIRFPSCRWSTDANYLFFRNYSPDKRKLSELLVPDRKYAAYACQCTWQSVKDLKPIQCGGTTAMPHGGTGGDRGNDVKWVLA
eukprot:g2396.t1